MGCRELFCYALLTKINFSLVTRKSSCVFCYRSYMTTPEISPSPLCPTPCDSGIHGQEQRDCGCAPCACAANPAEGRAVPWQCSQSCGASSQHSTGLSQWTSSDRASSWLPKIPSRLCAHPCRCTFVGKPQWQGCCWWAKFWKHY